VVQSSPSSQGAPSSLIVVQPATGSQELIVQGLPSSQIAWSGVLRQEPPWQTSTV
jgi:hypothetical protein